MPLMKEVIYFQNGLARRVMTAKIQACENNEVHSDVVEEPRKSESEGSSATGRRRTQQGCVLS